MVECIRVRLLLLSASTVIVGLWACAPLPLLPPHAAPATTTTVELIPGRIRGDTRPPPLEPRSPSPRPDQRSGAIESRAWETFNSVPTMPRAPAKPDVLPRRLPAPEPTPAPTAAVILSPAAGSTITVMPLAWPASVPILPTTFTRPADLTEPLHIGYDADEQSCDCGSVFCIRPINSCGRLWGPSAGEVAGHGLAVPIIESLDPY